VPRGGGGGLYGLPGFRSAVGLPPLPSKGAGVWDEGAVARRAEAKRAWKELPADRRAAVADLPIAASIDPNVPSDKQPRTIFEEADRIVPGREGVDLRPAFACLVGIVLTLALMFCTECWTRTQYPPVRSITKNSRTGDATNIIQGIAVGYESTVWAVILIAAAVFAGVFIYQETNSPLFIAFGVSLAGIGMLALTGDTLSMDVFGPVSDNANGIGEMGYNRDPDSHRALSPN